MTSDLSIAVIVAEHAKMVSDLVKPGDQILAEMSAGDANLVHMVLGISGEAGELLDAIKKKVIYRRSIDLANVIEELGDLEFYLQGLRQELNISRTECLEANLKKLSLRYRGAYSNAKAQARADKTNQ